MLLRHEASQSCCPRTSQLYKQNSRTQQNHVRLSRHMFLKTCSITSNTHTSCTTCGQHGESMWEHDDIIVLTLEVLHRNETNNGNLNKNQNNTFILLKNDSYRASPLLRLGASVDVSRCRHWPNIQPAQKERCRWHLQFLSYTHTWAHKQNTAYKQANKQTQTRTSRYL